MNSIIRNVVLLKVPLHKIKPSPLHATNITRNIGCDIQNGQTASQVYSAKYIEPISGENDSTKLTQSHARYTLKISKGRRDYSQRITKNSDQAKKRPKLIEGAEHIVVEDGRILKKKNRESEIKDETDHLLHNEDYDPAFDNQTVRVLDVKTILNINQKIHKEKKDRTYYDRHSVNKINYPIKSVVCKRIYKVTREPVKRQRLPTFNPLKRDYCLTKSTFSKYEVKKNEFKKDSYEEVAVSSGQNDIYPYFVDKLREAEVRKNAKGAAYPCIKLKKKPEPLYVIMKQMSKSKSGHRNLVYKVCNNATNFTPMKVQRGTIYDVQTSTLASHEAGSPKENSNRDNAKRQPKFDTKTREQFISNQGKSANPKNVTGDEEYKERLARTVRQLLQPVIEQEYMKYNELKSVLERMEKNINMYFGQNRDLRSNEYWNKPLLTNPIQFDTCRVPDRLINKIEDPSSNKEIEDPLKVRVAKREPSNKCEISTPCLKKEIIDDPKEHQVMIAASNLTDPCKKKNPCEKDDPCKKKDPCKKEDPCAKQKTDPCKKEEETEDPCKKAVFNDPCKKEDPCKKKDPCKKEDKEEDPCKKIESNKKDDPCKKEDPCKKKDPCKKEDKKEDPCAKMVSAKTDDPCKKNDDPCKKAMGFIPISVQNLLHKETFFISKGLYMEERSSNPFSGQNYFRLSKSVSYECSKKGGGVCHGNECQYDPFKKVKSKSNSFMSGNPKEECEDDSTQELNVPFKSKRRKDPFAYTGESCLKVEVKDAPCKNMCTQPSPKLQRQEKPPVECKSAPEMSSQRLQKSFGDNITKQKQTFVPSPPSPRPPAPLKILKPQQKLEPKKEPIVVPPLTPPPLTPPLLPPQAIPAPQKSLKETWKPVKVQPAAPRLKTVLPQPTLPKPVEVSKVDDPKKGFLDGCKGLFNNVFKMICPGKGSSGKKGACTVTAASKSMPNLRSYSNEQKEMSLRSKKKARKGRYPWRFAKLGAKKLDRKRCTVSVMSTGWQPKYAHKPRIQKSSKEKFINVVTHPQHDVTPTEKLMERLRTVQAANPPSEVDEGVSKLEKQIYMVNQRIERHSKERQVAKETFMRTSKARRNPALIQDRADPVYPRDLEPTEADQKNKDSLKTDVTIRGDTDTTKRHRYTWAELQAKRRCHDKAGNAGKKQEKKPDNTSIKKKYPWTRKNTKYVDLLDASAKQTLINEMAAKNRLEAEGAKKSHKVKGAKKEEASNASCKEMKCFEEYEAWKHKGKQKDKTTGGENSTTPRPLKKDAKNTSTKAETQVPTNREAKTQQLKERVAKSKMTRKSTLLCSDDSGCTLNLKMRVNPEKPEEGPKPEAIVAGGESKVKIEVKMKSDGCIVEPDQSLARQCARLSGKSALPKIVAYVPPEKEERCANPEFLLCEVRMIGNCEQLMCKPLPKAKPLELMTEPQPKRDPGVVRLLKCKIVQKGCEESLVCKEVKPNNDDEACNQKIEEVTEAQTSDKKHNKSARYLVISKKMVCRQELIPTTNNMELCCNVVEVQEIKDDPMTESAKVGVVRKPSPFTYKDLLKRSEEVRKKAEEELAKHTNEPSC